MPHGLEWLAAVAMGVTATAGQLAMTRAYAHAPAAQVGPFIYSAVVFAAALDWVFWRRLPDAYTVAGGVLVAGAGILSLRLNPARAEVGDAGTGHGLNVLRPGPSSTSNGAPPRRFSVRSAPRTAANSSSRSAAPPPRG